MTVLQKLQRFISQNTFEIIVVIMFLIGIVVGLFIWTVFVDNSGQTTKSRDLEGRVLALEEINRDSVSICLDSLLIEVRDIETQLRKICHASFDHLCEIQRLEEMIKERMEEGW